MDGRTSVAELFALRKLRLSHHRDPAATARGSGLQTVSFARKWHVSKENKIQDFVKAGNPTRKPKVPKTGLTTTTAHGIRVQPSSGCVRERRGTSQLA